MVQKKKQKAGRWLTGFRRAVLVAACVAVGLLWLCAFSARISPAMFSWLGVLTLGFPLLLALAVFMLLVMLLTDLRRAWIPLAGLLCCLGSIRSYVPINLPSPPPAGCLKVMTWNTQGFGSAKRDADKKFPAATYVARSGADILCFQEGFVWGENFKDIRRQLSARLPHWDTLQVGQNVFGIFSRYPVVGKRLLAGGQHNGAGVFLVKLAEEDTLRVVNTHLESMRLDKDDRKMWSDMVHQPDTADISQTKQKKLLSKLAASAAIRAEQADRVGDYIFRHRNDPLIVCGDFNDCPVSYAHRRIGKGLTDAFAATGNGVARTYNRDAIYVRIDHLFCSDHWKPYSCHVDDTVKLSDHYPVICHLKRMR